jgi:hypothetical protein
VEHHGAAGHGFFSRCRLRLSFAEGYAVYPDASVILRESKHPELAHQFINFLLRPDIAAANALTASAPPPPTPAPAKILDRPICRDQSDALSEGRLDYGNVLVAQTEASAWAITLEIRRRSGCAEPAALWTEIKNWKDSSKSSLDGLGVEPNQALFLDDRPENVRAAEAMGIHAVLFTTADEVAAELEHRFDIPALLVATLEEGDEKNQ